MRKVVAVGRAQGVALAADYAENRRAFCDGLPAEMTSSMHNDLERGNRLEVAWLSGGVAELGQAASVLTLINGPLATSSRSMLTASRRHNNCFYYSLRLLLVPPVRGIALLYFHRESELINNA
jgi:ketopantoate reductase